ncbi:unnamed protein product, partial [marine sediment metagenome]
MMKTKLLKINRNFILATILIFFLSLSWVQTVNAETELPGIISVITSPFTQGNPTSFAISNVTTLTCIP